MGIIRHDAIIVTSWCKKKLKKGRKKAISLGLPCTKMAHSNMNGYWSFLICPDGSKEGWEDSSLGKEARSIWCNWCLKKSMGFDWLHVSYGGDEPQNSHIVNGNAD